MLDTTEEMSKWILNQFLSSYLSYPMQQLLSWNHISASVLNLFFGGWEGVCWLSFEKNRVVQSSDAIYKPDEKATTFSVCFIYFWH